jgi:acyl-CoA thioesterase II
MVDSGREGAPATAGNTLDRLLGVQRTGVIRDTFVGQGHDYGPLRVYGGHLLGQGLAAAFSTVGEAMRAHSLHAYFLKTGAPGVSIGYQVERLRDGRSYATREVRAVQADHALMSLSVSFKTEEAGDEHQPVMPEVRDPAALARLRRRSPWGPLVLPFSDGLEVELVPVDDWRPQAPPADTAVIDLWMRAGLSDSADARARQCALAYLSDSTLMFNALRPHGNAFTTHRTTSLDHAVWFHRDGDPAEWLLFDQSGPVAADCRGLNFGRIFSADGRLVASVAQEAMMRRL